MIYSYCSFRLWFELVSLQDVLPNIVRDIPEIDCSFLKDLQIILLYVNFGYKEILTEKFVRPIARRAGRIILQ